MHNRTIVGAVLASCLLIGVVAWAAAPVSDAKPVSGSPQASAPAASATPAPSGAASGGSTPSANNASASNPAPATSSAPSVNNTPATVDPSLASQPIAARLSRLEQQMANLTQMNLPQQLATVQQQQQELTGQMQVLQRDLKTLNDQLNSFYQDLSKQITQVKNLSGTGATTSPPASQPPVSQPTPKKPRAIGAPKTTPHSLPSVKPGQSGEALSASSAGGQLYRQAFEVLLNKQYDLGATQMQAYLKKYPTGKYAPNAYYWLGEMALLKKDNQQALHSFEQVVKQFPQSSKVSDAQYKIALINIQQGKTAVARVRLETIKQQYPQSTAAQLANIQLQQLAGSHG